MSRATITIALIVAALATLRVASAQAPPVTLTAEGPATACAGKDIAFTFAFQIDTSRVNGLGSFDMREPRNTSFVSLEPLGSTTGEIGHSNADPALADTHVFSSTSSEPTGAVRFVVRTAPTFSGVITAGALVRGTGTASSNLITTQVAPCAGALPSTGFGRERGRILGLNREEQMRVVATLTIALLGLLRMATIALHRSR